MSDTADNKLRDFDVEWNMGIQARSPEEAAKIAWGIMRGQNSRATHFTVFDENGESHSVDVEET